MRTFDGNVKALAPADGVEIEALYERAMTAEPGIGPVSQADWNRFVALPQNLEGRDFRVAFAGDRLAGLLESSPRDSLEGRARFFKIVVDPAYRRQGLGSGLLDVVLGFDDDPQTALQTLVRPDWTAALAFLARFGFARVEDEIGMTCARTPEAGEEMSWLVFERVGDLAGAAASLARLHNAAYADDAGFRPHSPEEIVGLLATGEVWAARERGDVVAFCKIEPEPDHFWIESLAVDPARRGRGVGSALLRHILRAQPMGSGCCAALQVSSRNGAARRLYARLGFVETDRRARFEATRVEVLRRLRG